MNNLLWLQEFYLSNCDGDWEHSWGIRIETLDNPGWQLIVDLEQTLLELKSFQDLSIERSADDWVACSIRDKKFNAVGGPKNLDEIIGIFRKWTEENGISC